MVTTNDSTNEETRESSPLPSAGPCSLWLRFCKWYHALLTRLFGLLGQTTARHPWGAILCCTLFVGLSASGFAFYKSENRAEKLYIPLNSQSMKDLDRAEKYFGQMRSRLQILILLPKPGSNILTAECFLDALKIHQEITSLPSYKDYCLTANGSEATAISDCLTSNPLEIFGYETTNFDNITGKLTAVFEDPSLLLSNGRPASHSASGMFSKMKRNSSTGEIEYAEAVQLIYYTQDPVDDSRLNDVRAWELSFVNKIESLRQSMKCVTIYYSAARSIDDAIATNANSDLWLVSLTFALMITFANLMLSNFMNPLTNRALLPNIGIMAVGLGIFCGLGVTMLCQIPFVTIVGVIPFLVIGVGIDDMFIIMHELGRHDPDKPVDETIKVILKHCGATVTMTTLTDLVAFAVSTMTEFNAIKYFCIYAGLSITCAYGMIITLFVAFMTFDQRRVQARRRTCLPCWRVSPRDSSLPPWSTLQPKLSSKVMEVWGKFLMLPATKATVVILSMALLGSGIYGAIHIKEDFNLQVLAKDGSTFKQFAQVQEKYFLQGIPVNLILSDPVEYETASVQTDILALSGVVTANKLYENTSLSWIHSFTKFSRQLKIKATGKDFLPSLQKFLRVKRFSHFTQDLRFSKDKKRLVASRELVFIKATTSSTDHRDAMLTLREDLKTKTPLPVYAFSKSFVYFEQYAITMSETIRNLSIAAATILVITCPFLVDFSVTMLVFFSFVALIFELFGIMYVWDVPLNSVSMINLVMAIGFSVDYSAHIAHAYVTSSEETPERRVVAALKSLGASVFLGGFSTFIGMALTGFSQSELFQIFFKMFLGIVLLGQLHGLCFLPVYLSIICRWSPTITAVASEHENEVSEQRNLTDGLLTAKEEKDDEHATARLTNGGGEFPKEDWKTFNVELLPESLDRVTVL